MPYNTLLGESIQRTYRRVSSARRPYGVLITNPIITRITSMKATVKNQESSFFVTDDNGSFKKREFAKKYEFTGETIEVGFKTLHRIRALRDFGDVKKGDLGGFIGSEYNLSHHGNCWVGGKAKVYANARVYDNAVVSGYAHVNVEACIYENARVYGKAVVGGFVYGNAEVYGFARIYPRARIYGNAHVHYNAWVFNDTHIFGNAKLSGYACIYADVKVYGNAKVLGFSKLYKNAHVHGNAVIEGHAEIHGIIYGNAKISGYSKIYGKVSGKAKLRECDFVHREGEVYSGNKVIYNSNNILEKAA
ncbi:MULTISPECIES: hypothetical protein [unclassified Bartonella]|uniref:hypothetical protein n=2 Tax=unclassified Bartonella TaxID=2645622 RepID=UPI0035D04304